MSTEHRLREALAARAAAVTPATLRPAQPPPSRGARTWWWAAPALAGAVAITVVVLAVLLSPGDTSRTQGPPATRQGPSVHRVMTSGHCPREAAVVTAGLDRSTRQVDVDGDGTLDVVALAQDRQAPAQCRAFAAVRTADGAVYSAAFDRSALPFGSAPEIVATPRLGGDATAELMVDTHAGADAAVSQLFTLTGGRLLRVPDPTTRDGNFIIEGGGINYPRAAGCTTDGELTEIGASSQGPSSFDVTERRLALQGAQLRVVFRHVTRDVPARQLDQRFPVLRGYDFTACEPGG
jgi:hypothetical protein